MISGAQTGADQGGLYAAEAVGFETGGTMPKGYRTELGSDLALAERFGLTEHYSWNYVPRTYQNVQDADVTIRIAKYFDSPGEKVTKNAIDHYKKEYLDIHFDSPLKPEEVAQWLLDNNVKVLNVAGNTESRHPGLQAFVIEYLTEVFQKVKECPKIAPSELKSPDA